MEYQVFQNKLITARQSFFSHIRPDSRILIVGGGIGTELSGLNQLLPGTRVDFVDHSPSMILRARKQPQAYLEVGYYSTLDEILQYRYDHIFFHFFLDLYSQTDVECFLRKAMGLLYSHGKISVVDFQYSSAVKNLLIRIMYLVYRSFVPTAASCLPDFYSAYQKCGLSIEQERQLEGRMIMAHQLKQ